MVSLPYFIEVEGCAKSLDMQALKFNSTPSFLAVSPDEQFIALASKTQVAFGMIEGSSGKEDLFIQGTNLEQTLSLSTVTLDLDSHNLIIEKVLISQHNELVIYLTRDPLSNEPR